MHLPRVFVLLVAAAAAVTTGCGQSGPMSHAELVRRANTACSDAIRTITATGAPRDLATLGRIGDHQVDLADDQVSRIADLHPAAGDRAAHRRLVDALRRAIEADRRLVDDARSGDVRALAADGATADAARTRARNAARALGAAACATAPPA